MRLPRVAVKKGVASAERDSRSDHAEGTRDEPSEINRAVKGSEVSIEMASSVALRGYPGAGNTQKLCNWAEAMWTGRGWGTRFWQERAEMTLFLLVARDTEAVEFRISVAW